MHYFFRAHIISMSYFNESNSFRFLTLRMFRALLTLRDIEFFTQVLVSIFYLSFVKMKTFSFQSCVYLSYTLDVITHQVWKIQMFKEKIMKSFSLCPAHHILMSAKD